MRGSLAPSSPQPAARRRWEVCWGGRALPRAAPLNGTWSLVDDGGHKGVSKLGLASTAVGERAALGPLPGPATAGTGARS